MVGGGWVGGAKRVGEAGVRRLFYIHSWLIKAFDFLQL